MRRYTNNSRRSFSVSDTLSPQAESVAAPLPPAGARILTLKEIENAFDALDWQAVPGDPSGIVIAEKWLNSNLVRTAQLKPLEGKPVCGLPGRLAGYATVHRRIRPFMENAFDAIHRAGLADHILCWGGAFTPRRQRGSSTVSRHAYGIAFDINTQWNPYKMQPAPTGHTGSVTAIVPILAANGFYWGGWFKNNPDGMHFEFYRADWL